MAKPGQLKYKFTNYLKESHGEPLFCVDFNFIDPHHKDIFATVGQSRATIYRCLPNGDFEMLQAYEDADKGRKHKSKDGDISKEGEYFYVCRWSRCELTGAPYLLLAGEKGLVRVLDVNRETLVHTFAGHGKAINDISVHPTRHALFLTASLDESIRLWNIRTKTCVMIFAGEGGHKNGVISLDWHPWNPYHFLSSAMDNCVQIWSMEAQAELINQSYSWDQPDIAFPTKVVQQPLFSSLQIHSDYADCARWLGDVIVSKSVDDKIVLWQPELEDELSRRHLKTSNQCTVLGEYILADSLKTWFVRFGLDYQCHVMACGSAKGKVFVWHTPSWPPGRGKQLTSPHCKAVVRQVAVSYDGTTILAACEDASLQRWDLEALGGRPEGMDLGPSAANSAHESELEEDQLQEE